MRQDSCVSYFHNDRNLEQLLAPITLIRGGSSRGFYFEGRNVPKPGAGLEEFLLAVRGSPDPMGMDGLGGDTILQSKTAIVSPSGRPDADVDYTFIQIFPDQTATVTYKMNCGSRGTRVRPDEEHDPGREGRQGHGSRVLHEHPEDDVHDP
jgi:2-methylaconitate isomerase